MLKQGQSQVSQDKRSLILLTVNFQVIKRKCWVKNARREPVEGESACETPGPEHRRVRLFQANILTFRSPSITQSLIPVLHDLPDGQSVTWRAEQSGPDLGPQGRVVCASLAVSVTHTTFLNKWP